MTPPAGPIPGPGSHRTPTPPPTRHLGGRRLDAALHLLDRQIIDRDGRLAGKVDDLALDRRPDGTLVVTALLTGPGALGPRLPGVLQRGTLAVWRRLHAGRPARPARIDLASVAEIGAAVRVSMARRDMPNQALEDLARRQIVEKLPGAGHDPG